MNIHLALVKAALAASIVCLAAPATAQTAVRPTEPMVGGYQPADVRDERVLAAARFAATKVGSSGTSLRSINAAERQIVQGTNYKLDITVSNGQRWLVTVYEPLRGAMLVTQQQIVVTTSPVAAPPNWRSYPNGSTISLSFVEAGIGGTGTITRRHRGQRTRSVTIGYMAEFIEILAENRVAYRVVGPTTDRGEESIDCVATINWSRGRIVSRRSRGAPARTDSVSCG